VRPEGILPPVSPRMLRRISTKLILAVLAASVLPFVAFAFYLNERIADRLTRHVVQQALLGLAKDLAGQIDYFVRERSIDLQQWADDRFTQLAIDDYLTEKARQERARRGQGAGPSFVWDAAAVSDPGPRTTAMRDLFERAARTEEFNDTLDLKEVYDLVLLVAADGRLVTCSSKYPGARDPRPLSRSFLEYLFAYDYSREAWFQSALAGEAARVDHHISPLHIRIDDPDRAWDYQLGFAQPVRSSQVPDEVSGVLFALVSWKFVQDLVATQVITDAFRGLVEEDREPSPYAWLWAADADTILAHPDRGLYYRSITRDVELPQLVQAIRDDRDGWGLYPEYDYRGKAKNAAFKRCPGPDKGGFGWVVGVGIDNDDIYATAEELRALLMGGTAGVLVLAVLLTWFIARRTTGPIRELQERVRRVAEGDLATRIEIRSKDELGVLAEDFNRMTERLAEQRERIVKAEKDAAWREMARQIAHDIKNPLTPITLSLDLLERARREGASGSEEILERTMGLMRRQVENLRAIANDFYEFTGGRKAVPRDVDLDELLDEVLHLHDAWAVERGVEVQREGPACRVWADPGKLRRVLVNLVSNALQAMPDGGRLLVDVSVEGPRVRIAIHDTGPGLTPEAREHLFEPYFTTKSEGTGLGLAIAHRAIEEMGGEIDLGPGPGGQGAVASVVLARSTGDGPAS
jgi:signal transduction histidine kinase